MREIKFRVYTEVSNEVLGMKYFDLKDAHNHVNDTVMQFTGLLDKKGKEIYEGDIRMGKWFFQTEETTRYQVMKWSDENACFYWEGIDFPDFVGVEVIGNIYQNPELLKS